MMQQVHLTDRLKMRHPIFINCAAEIEEIKEDFLALLVEVNKSEKLVWTMLTQLREGLCAYLKGPMVKIIEEMVLSNIQSGLCGCGVLAKFSKLKKRYTQHFCYRKQLNLYLSFLKEEGLVQAYQTSLLQMLRNQSEFTPLRFSKSWKQLLQFRLISAMLLVFELQISEKKRVFNVLDLWYKLYPELPICDMIDERFKGKKQQQSCHRQSQQASYELSQLEREFQQLLKIEGCQEELTPQEESSCNFLSEQMESLSLEQPSFLNSQTVPNFQEKSHHKSEKIQEDQDDLEDQFNKIHIESNPSPHAQDALKTPQRDVQNVLMPLHDSTNLRLAYDGSAEQQPFKSFSAQQLKGSVLPQITPFLTQGFQAPLIMRNPSHQIFEVENICNSQQGINFFVPSQ